MTYQPNFTDPRVIARIRHAYGFTRAVMSTTKPTRWARDTINKYLGHQTNKLGRYLRELLLITTDSHYSMDTGTPKEYLLNACGLSYLRHQLTSPDNVPFAQWAQNNKNRTDEDHNYNSYPSVIHLFDKQVVIEWAKREYHTELANADFVYEDKSNRLWHPLQNIKREFKSDVLSLAGLNYHYDIDAAAPTLIWRYAQQLGMDEWPVALNEYLEHKAVVRQSLADLVDLPVKDIKVLINALFCGARLGNNNQFALYRLLGNRQRVEYIRNNQFVCELRSDISKCWSVITKTMARRTTTDINGRERLLPVSSKQKWIVYFQLERQVLNAVRSYLRGTGNPHFLEHDGWTTKQPINIDALVAHVYNITGFKISISS